MNISLPDAGGNQALKPRIQCRMLEYWLTRLIPELRERPSRSV